MIKLVTIDIDGTLITPFRRLTKKNKQSIIKAKDMGLKIALCSGRPYSAIKPYVEELDLLHNESFSISQNGSYVFDNQTGEVITGNFQYTKDLILLDKIFENFSVQVSAMDSTSFYTRHKRANIFTKIDSHLTKQKLIFKPYDTFEEDHNFGRFLILGTTWEINRIIANPPRRLKDNFYFVKTAPFLIEVMHKNTNKGAAVKLMAEKLGIKQEETMSIGNENNDIPMFDYTELSVAVDNASDVVKSHANFITKSNRESGVSYALEKLMANDFENFAKK